MGNVHGKAEAKGQGKIREGAIRGISRRARGTTSCGGNGGYYFSESLAQGESRAGNGTNNAMLRIIWTNVEAS